MKMKVLSLCILSGALLLTGCASDTTDPTTGKQTVADPSTVSFSGYVSQVDGNLVTVTNGVSSYQYDIGNATVVSNGNTNVPSVGMVVDVVATPSATGPLMADTLTYDTEVEGIVISNTIQSDYSGEMDVMGQIVIVDARTKYTGFFDATEILVDTRVEVSGIVQDNNGKILAKYIELHTDNDSEIKGTITDLTDTSFMLGECQINIDDNTLYDDGLTSAADLVDGIDVEVKIAMVDTTAPCPATAAKIELENDNGMMPTLPVTPPVDTPPVTPPVDTPPVTPPVDTPPVTPPVDTPPVTTPPGQTPPPSLPPADVVMLKGMAVDAPSADNMLQIETIDPATGPVIETVMLTVDTFYEGGSIVDIVAGTPLKVKATLDANNQLIADRVVIRIKDVPIIDLIELEGDVVADALNNEFEISYPDPADSTLKITTLVRYTGTTMITGGDILAGSFVVVKGKFDATATDVLNADSIMVNPPVRKMDVVIMEGMLERVDLDVGTMVVMGQTFVVTDTTVITGIPPMPIVAPLPIVPPAGNPVGTMAIHPATPPVEMPIITLADLKVGDLVAVVAHHDADRNMVVMQIHSAPADPTIPSFVKGKAKVTTVDNGVDPVTTSYVVEHVDVTVTAATEMPKNPIVDGMMLKVIGTYDVTTEVLTADSMEIM